MRVIADGDEPDCSVEIVINRNGSIRIYTTTLVNGLIEQQGVTLPSDEAKLMIECLAAGLAGKENSNG